MPRTPWRRRCRARGRAGTSGTTSGRILAAASTSSPRSTSAPTRAARWRRTTRSCGRRPTRAGDRSTPPSATRRKAFRRHPSSITSGEPFCGRLVRYDFGECLLKTNRSSSAAPTSRSLSELGVNAYPHRFDRTATITELVRAHGENTGAELEATPHRDDHERPHSGHSQFRQGEFPGALRRPVAHPGLHQEGLALGARLRGVPPARFRRCRRRRRASVPHTHERADDLGVATRVSCEVPPAAAGEVAWPDRRRNSLSPALPRSHRQSRGARGVPGAQQGAFGAARRFSMPADISRSRRR